MTDSNDYYPIYDFKFVTGDYVRRTFLFQDEDPMSPDPENPILIPRDLTNWTGRAQIRENSTDRQSAIVATFTVTIGETDPSDGMVILELPAIESAKCVKKSGWDLELMDPNGHPRTFVGGSVRPKLDYTR